MPSLEIDLTYGLKKETDIITTLSTFFEKDLKKTTDHFCKWDFEDEERNLTIELKSRRNTMMAYPTTLIPIHKITNETQNLYFVFQFLDKLAYIKYEKSTFDEFKTCYITARGRDKGAMHYLIDISLLSIIT
jgi:hypothetical protein